MYDKSSYSTVLNNFFKKNTAYAAYALYQLGLNENCAICNQFIGCISEGRESAWCQSNGDSLTELNNGSYNWCAVTTNCPCYHPGSGPRNHILFDTYTCNTGLQTFGLACYVDSALQPASHICAANNSVSYEIVNWRGNFRLSNCIFADDVSLIYSLGSYTAEATECLFAHEYEQLQSFTFTNCSFGLKSLSVFDEKPWKCIQLRTKLFSMHNNFPMLSKILLIICCIFCFKE